MTGIHAALARPAARTLSLCAVLIAAAGCRPAVDVTNPSPFEEDDPGAASSDRRAPAGTAGGEPVRPQPAPASGQVERSRLHAVLDAGPGALLSGIEVHPRLDLRNQFQGWEVLRFAYTWADIRPGDVISTINGQPLGRPHEVQELWTQLRSADAIVVVGERDGSPLELRFDVTNDAVGPDEAVAP
jgi:S1-C subfamily serine protease